MRGEWRNPNMPMRKLLALLLFLVSLGKAHAQGTLNFATHMTGNTMYFGDGTFSLSGDVFTYDLRTDWIFNTAEIHGPAISGTNAPLIFNLHLRFCEPPLGEYRGGCVYRGNFTLSEEQTTDLVNEQWYVYSSYGGELFLRGQIIQVPEPSGVSLILIGLGFGYLCLRRNPRQCS